MVDRLARHVERATVAVIAFDKIEKDPANPMLIRTVWGVGYEFSPSDP